MLNVATAEDALTRHTILSRAAGDASSISSPAPNPASSSSSPPSSLLAYLLEEGLELMHLQLLLHRRAVMLQQQQQQQRSTTLAVTTVAVPSPFDFVSSNGVTLLAAAVVGCDAASGLAVSPTAGDSDSSSGGRGDERSDAAIAAAVAAILRAAAATQRVPKNPSRQQQQQHASEVEEMTTIGPLGIDVDLPVPRYGGQTALQLSEGLALEEVSRTLAVA